MASEDITNGNPMSFDKTHLIVNCLYRLGQDDEAMNIIDSALMSRDMNTITNQKERGSLRNVIYTKASILQSKGKHHEAVPLLEQVMAMTNPRDSLSPIISQHLAEAYESVGELRKALDLDFKVDCYHHQ